MEDMAKSTKNKKNIKSQTLQKLLRRNNNCYKTRPNKLCETQIFITVYEKTGGKLVMVENV